MLSSICGMKTYSSLAISEVNIDTYFCGASKIQLSTFVDLATILKKIFMQRAPDIQYMISESILRKCFPKNSVHHGIMHLLMGVALVKI